MFLRKQSRNSLANWWSVCFKMFFSNGFICVVASATLSHRVWKLFLCSFVLFFKRKGFYSFIAFFKYAKLAKFIQSEARWKLYIFNHKVHGDVVKWWCFWGLWGTLELKVWRLCAAMFFLKLSYWCFESIISVQVFVYLIEATCTMNLQNPTNGSKLPSRDFANPPKR